MVVQHDDKSGNIFETKISFSSLEWIKGFVRCVEENAKVY